MLMIIGPKKKLERLIPLFQNKNIGIVYSNHWIINHKSKKKNIYTNKVLPKGNISSNIFSVFIWNFAYHDYKKNGVL